LGEDGSGLVVSNYLPSNGRDIEACIQLFPANIEDRENLYNYASDNPVLHTDPSGDIAAAVPYIAGAAVIAGAACYVTNCGQTLANAIKSGVESIIQMMTAPGRVADSQIVRDYEEAASEARRCGREPPDRCKWLDENRSRYRQDQVIPTQKAWGCRRRR
jgi:hypothetical protein